MKELIKLAKEKGFISHFNKEWKYSSKEPLRQLFELTELQQWLRDIHNIDVFAFSNRFTGHIDISYYTYSIEGIIPVKNYRFNTYEEALEQGLYQALKLIKNDI